MLYYRLMKKRAELVGVDIIQAHRPLWVCKLSDDKLRQFLDLLNEFVLKGNTDSELLLCTAETWYHNPIEINNIMSLANDVYKEAAIRWYEGQENKD